MKLEDRSILAQNIIRRRKAKRWNQGDLAHKAGYHLQYIKEIETDKKKPSLTTIRDLAHALGSEASDLISEASVAQSEAADLIIEIVRLLPSLDQKQLRSVGGIVKGYASSATASSRKAR